MKPTAFIRTWIAFAIRTWIAFASKSWIAKILRIILFIAFPILINRLIVGILLPQYTWLAVFIWVVGGVCLYYFLKAISPSLYNTKYFGWLGILLLLIVGLFIFVFTAQVLFSQGGLLSGIFWTIWGLNLLKILLIFVFSQKREYLAWIAVVAFLLPGVLIYVAPILTLITSAIISIAQQIQPGKNLWGWLTSIITPVLIPFSIAFWGLLQQNSQQEISEANSTLKCTSSKSSSDKGS